MAVNVIEFFAPNAAVIGSVVEGVGTVKSGAELVTGDPQSMLIQQTTNTVQRVAVMIFKVERLVPWIGFIGNGVSLYVNFKDAVTIHQ